VGGDHRTPPRRLSYTGTLANHPSALTEPAYDDPVSFGPEHIVAIQFHFEELGYEPGDPVVIDPRIIREDRAPAVVNFARPPARSLRSGSRRSRAARLVCRPRSRRRTIGHPPRALARGGSAVDAMSTWIASH